MSLIRIQNGDLAFGHVPLLDHVELNVADKERVCLIGRNGTGKSTLLKVLAGEQTLDGGTLWQRDGLKVALLSQEVPETASSSLYEVVAAGLGDFSELLARYHQASHTLAERGDRVTAQELENFGRLQAEVESAGAWEGSQRVDAVLSRLALPADSRMSECSGGVRRRAMLGQALVSEPDLLLLDEPTNHLDIEAIEALEAAVLDYPGAVVFITHDRTFIDHLATRIVELDRGTLRSFPGNFATYLKSKAALLDAEETANRKFDQDLAQEEVWIRQGIKARRTRNEGRVRRLEAMRRERAARRERTGKAKMSLASGDRSGKIVVEADRATFAYDGQPVIAGFSTLIQRGDRIGIIGRNGSGKTTLLKGLLGQLEPAAGTIMHGTRLSVAYFDQERQQLDEERSVRDNLAEGSDTIEINGKSRHVISYLADFLFPPARAQSPVKALSGGERNRLLLARLFARPANLLVLDEPTNDLDMETLELLEELLSDYKGTLLLVSHDRSFIDRTVTSTMVVDGSGSVEEYVGGYSDWVRYRNSLAESTAPAGPAGQKATSGRSADRQNDAPSTKARAGAISPKLSYKEQRELDALPGLIESLEERHDAMQKRTAEPDFYQQPKEAIAAAMRELADNESALHEAYARWEEIEARSNS